MLGIFRSKHTSFVWFTESLLLLALFVVAADTRVPWENAPKVFRLLGEVTLATLITQGAIYFSGLYADDFVRAPQRMLERFAKAIGAAAAIIILVDFAFGVVELPKSFLLLGSLLALVALPLWRYAYQTICSNNRFVRRVLVLGNGELARDVAELIRTRCLGMVLVGRLGRPGDVAPAEGVIGTYGDLINVVLAQGVDVVIVADAERRDCLPVEQLLALKLNGVEIREGTTFYEYSTGKIHVQSIKPSQLFFTEGFDSRPLARFLKRSFDLLTAATALLLATPIMVLTAAAIRLESRGPVLYSQIRVGERRREFSIVKFRSMRLDAEKDGARWASATDDRVTRVGRFIRKTRIDELPQLWNVIRGDMSLVGPRPERPIFVDELERQIPYFSQRLYVRPGVTGHAQVLCRYAASVEDSVEKLQYDLYYIKRFSLLFDLSILLDTVKVVLLRIGSR